MRRLVARIVFVLVWIDIWILYLLGKAVNWLVEWGIARIRLERAVVLVYALVTTFDGTRKFITHSELVSNRLGDVSLLVLNLWNSFMFWEVERTENHRARRRCSLGFFASRIAVLTLWVITLMIFTFSREAYLLVMQCTALVLIIYLLSVGDGGGEPGRRKQLALDKLKEMFGSEWMPEPAPQQIYGGTR
jgi:hypothetical protein